MLHFIYCCAECNNADCHYAECHYAECHYAECHYAECHSALFFVDVDVKQTLQIDKPVQKLEPINLILLRRGKPV